VWRWRLNCVYNLCLQPVSTNGSPTPLQVVCLLRPPTPSKQEVEGGGSARCVMLAALYCVCMCKRCCCTGTAVGGRIRTCVHSGALCNACAALAVNWGVGGATTVCGDVERAVRQQRALQRVSGVGCVVPAAQQAHSHVMW
jgi:hypothetical protein